MIHYWIITVLNRCCALHLGLIKMRWYHWFMGKIYIISDELEDKMLIIDKHGSKRQKDKATQLNDSFLYVKKNIVMLSWVMSIAYVLLYISFVAAILQSSIIVSVIRQVANIIGTTVLFVLIALLHKLTSNAVTRSHLYAAEIIAIANDVEYNRK